MSISTLPQLLVLGIATLSCAGCQYLDGSGADADAGPVPTSQAVIGMWGTPKADGTADADNAYFFASTGGWGHVESSICTDGKTYSVNGNVMELLTGEKLTDYDVSFSKAGDGSTPLLHLVVPGSETDSGASSQPSFVLQQIDAVDHSCAGM